MTNAQKLILVKLLHTFIWLFFNVVIFYFCYAVVANKIDHWVWICIGLVMLEGLVLLIFKKSCPITVVARNYSNSRKDNFDIFLPNWLAKYNKTIYTAIFVAALLVLFFRLMSSNGR